MDYEHPIYTPESVAAQRRLPRSTTAGPRSPAPTTAGASTRTAAPPACGPPRRWACRGDGRARACGRARSPRAGAGALRRRGAPHRHAALHRDFRHRVYLWLVDLDALPRLPAAGCGPFARFEAADHLGDPGGIDPRQRRPLPRPRHGIDLRGGRVLMLANARVLGLTCSTRSRSTGATGPTGRSRASSPRCTTPTASGTATCCAPTTPGRARGGKEFYVSPFFAVDGGYRMHLPVPGAAAAPRDHAAAERLDGVRRERGRGAHRRHPARARPHGGAPTARHAPHVGPDPRHGVALWLRRLPVVPRPRHAPQEGVQ